MNTQKQITVMVTLVFVLLAGCAAYTVYDQPRENASADAQAATYAERGARIFARYCRQCHGDAGQGRIGPALNRPDLQDPLTRDQTVQWVTDTITCGRIGKIMPPWAISEGGALDTEQIKDLVDLITTNAGNGWGKAAEFSKQENETAPEPSISDVLASGVITGSTSVRVCGQLYATPAPEANSGPPAGVAAKTEWDETTTDNKFSTTVMVVPAGQPITVNVNNAGQATHNWDVLNAQGQPSLKDASGKDIITTTPNQNLLLPNDKATVTFTISTPGTYDYRCDVHPTDMTGKLYVVSGSGAAASPTPAP